MNASTAVGGTRCPPWSRWRDAAWLLVRGVTVRRCVPIALVVGFVLSAINQGTIIVGGQASWGTWVRVVSNFVVPFLVSSYGFLCSGRVSPCAPSRGEPREPTRWP